MNRLRAIVSIIALFALSAPAFPLGFGIFGTGGGGRSDALQRDYSVRYSFDHFSYGGGILFESGNDEDGYHNRFSLLAQPYEPRNARDSYRRLYEFGLENTWAFGIVNRDRIRLWIGPGMGMQLISGHVRTYRRWEWSRTQQDNLTTIAAINSSSPLITPLWYYINYDPLWKLTTGTLIYLSGALGVNVGMSDMAWFFVEAGARIGYQYLNTHAFAYEGYGKVGFIFGKI